MIMLYYKGYQKAYTKRTEKSGGTINMRGVCPSRLIVGLLENGHLQQHFFDIFVISNFAFMTLSCQFQ
jgi:hypothetical protein